MDKANPALAAAWKWWCALPRAPAKQGGSSLVRPVDPLRSIREVEDGGLPLRIAHGGEEGIGGLHDRDGLSIGSRYFRLRRGLRGAMDGGGAAERGGGEAREQFPVEHDIPLEFAWSGNRLRVWTLVSSLKTKTQRESVVDRDINFFRKLQSYR
jgi:hypothetical protein